MIKYQYLSCIIGLHFFKNGVYNDYRSLTIGCVRTNWRILARQPNGLNGQERTKRAPEKEGRKEGDLNCE